MRKWSEKQLSFWHHANSFINIADGAVRSGKTHVVLLKYARFCREGPPGDFAVFGKTERTVRRNVVNELKRLLPPGTVKYNQGAGELYIYDRLNWIVGANNVEAEEKVRGMTLAGGYWNEMTLYPQEVVDQSIARSLSVPHARFYGDCNPDSPYHWLMEHYLDAGHPKKYLKRFRFKITDNPILPQENIEMIKALYGPGTLFYRRMVEGDWCIAQGAIYAQFDERYHVVDFWPSKFSKVVVGVDYGTSMTTAFLMAGLSVDDGKWYAFREYYWDAQARGRQKTDGEYAVDLMAFIKGIGYPDPYGMQMPTSIEMDPSAASFRLEAKRHGINRVKLADNDVLDGIRVVSTALTGGEYFIHRVCENVRKEKASYVWDEKAQEKGQDKPLKQYDHAQDAERYMLMKAIGKRGLHLVQTNYA